VWSGHSCPLPLTLPLTFHFAFDEQPQTPVIPTGAGAPATAEWRNLLFSGATVPSIPRPKRARREQNRGAIITLVPISDTTPEAQAVQLEIHRSMTGEQRLLVAFEMCEFGRELNRARLRQEHPDWTERQITRELLRLAFFPKPQPAGF
jgi:hypothetical protein